MKILLVNPVAPDTFWSLNYALEFISKKALLPPLGLLTVAALLPDDWDIRLVDMNTASLGDKDIEWADMVFLTAMFIQRKSAEEVIERCKKAGKRIVAGGPLFNSMPEYYTHVDHLVMNEAEVTLPVFLEDLENGDAGPYYTSREKPDLAQSPIPRWDLVDMDQYAIMGVQYSRGCPYNCDFCDITKHFGHVVRTKTTGQLLEELEVIYKLGWRREVFFVDDNFIGQKKRLKEDVLPALIEWMDERDYPFSFNTQASVDMADDEELMSMMARAGIDCVFVGIETPSEESLAECHKKQNQSRDLIESVQKIQRAGMEVQAGFILGFDSDKPEVFDNLISFIQKSGIMVAMVGLLNAPRGTALFKRLQRENRLPSVPTGDNTDYSINFVPRMDLNELMDGYERVVSTIYSPKCYYERIVTFLEQYQPNERIRPYFQYRDIRGLLRSIWYIGIWDRGAYYYWKLFVRTMWNRYSFRHAISFGVYGYHFRKTFQRIKTNRNRQVAANQLTTSGKTAEQFSPDLEKSEIV